MCLCYWIRTNRSGLLLLQRKKIYLEINTQYIFVSGENQQEIEGFTTRNASKSSKTKEDRMCVTLKKVKGLKANDRDSFWKEIELQSYTKNRYRTELERLRKQHPKLIIAPYFISKEGEKMDLSNYFYVKLKSKEDYNTLWSEIWCIRNSLQKISLQTINWIFPVCNWVFI